VKYREYERGTNSTLDDVTSSQLLTYRPVEDS